MGNVPCTHGDPMLGRCTDQCWGDNGYRDGLRTEKIIDCVFFDTCAAIDLHGGVVGECQSEVAGGCVGSVGCSGTLGYIRILSPNLMFLLDFGQVRWERWLKCFTWACSNGDQRKKRSGWERERGKREILLIDWNINEWL